MTWKTLTSVVILSVLITEQVVLGQFVKDKASSGVSPPSVSVSPTTESTVIESEDPKSNIYSTQAAGDAKVTLQTPSVTENPQVTSGKDAETSGSNETIINRTPNGNGSTSVSDDHRNKGDNSTAENDMTAETSLSTTPATVETAPSSEVNGTAATNETAMGEVGNDNTTVIPPGNEEGGTATTSSETTSVPMSSKAIDTSGLDFTTAEMLTTLAMNETSSNDTVTNSAAPGDLDMTTVGTTDINGTAVNRTIETNGTTSALTTENVLADTSPTVIPKTDQVTTEEVRDNDTKEKGTPQADVKESTSAKPHTVTDLTPARNSKSAATPSPSTSLKTSSTTISVSAVEDNKQSHGKGKRLALGIIIPCLIVLVVAGAIFAYRKLKKKGRGYITLDDLGNFQGMNNPNYDPEL